MKLVIERAAFLKSMAHVASIVSRRDTVPILQNVKLDASAGVLTLSGTDMDMEFSEDVPAAVDKKGATTVNAAILHDIVRKTPDGAQVMLQTNDSGVLQVSAGRARFTLPTLPVEDFPLIAVGDFSRVFTIPVAQLLYLINNTKFAISTEETRYYLNGIYLHAVRNNILRTVATDGHRLARAEVAMPEGGEGMPGIIVPRKTVLELAKVIADQTGDIELSVSDSKIRASFGAVCITSKVIDGTFPDYERVIPTGNYKHIDVTAEELSRALDRVTAITSDRARSVKLECASNSIRLCASDASGGTATEDVDAKYDGSLIDVGFNAKCLIEILGHVQSASARLSLSDSGSPAIVTSEDDANALYVLMPMRV